MGSPAVAAFIAFWAFWILLVNELKECLCQIAKYARFAPLQIAGVYAQRGDLDQAFAWLDRAYQRRNDSSLAT